MKRVDLIKRKQARLMKALTENVNAPWGKLKELAEQQEYPNGTRVKYFMGENVTTRDKPKTGTIVKFLGLTPNGFETYEIYDDEAKMSMSHTFYIVEVLEKPNESKKEADEHKSTGSENLGPGEED